MLFAEIEKKTCIKHQKRLVFSVCNWCWWEIHFFVRKQNFFLNYHNKVFFVNLRKNVASEMLSLLYVAHFDEKNTFLT